MSRLDPTRGALLAGNVEQAAVRDGSKQVLRTLNKHVPTKNRNQEDMLLTNEEAESTLYMLHIPRPHMIFNWLPQSLALSSPLTKTSHHSCQNLQMQSFASHAQQEDMFGWQGCRAAFDTAPGSQIPKGQRCRANGWHTAALRNRATRGV